jgi:methylmalonyl-CoA/ethylmalonyl-CoA epimerase
LAQAPPDQDVPEFELQFPHGVRLDVLTPRDPAAAGAVARFLERFGPGIQQVECEVLDVTRATELIRARFDLEPVYPEVRAGADGTRVTFFLAPAAEGRKVLIELVEVPDTKKKK